jgi:hypothetical protein
MNRGGFVARGDIFAADYRVISVTVSPGVGQRIEFMCVG